MYKIENDTKINIDQIKKAPKPTDGNLKRFANWIGVAEEKNWTDEDWEATKQQNVKEAENKEVHDKIKQENATITSWLRLYVQGVQAYKRDVYGEGISNTSILHRQSILNQLEWSINDEYMQQLEAIRATLQSDIVNSQNDKSLSMKTAKLFDFIPPTNYKYGGNDNHYISYLIPITVPSTYDMQFVSIFLPAFDGEIIVNPMQNMHYKMPQTDKLLYHEMMANGETIMFIRTDMSESQLSYTKIVASSSGVLGYRTKPLTVLKQKRVQLVSYCESQNVFCILFDTQFAFAVYQQGRIDFTNKVEDLRETSWWHEDLKYKALLMQEINKNIIVWLIDENNVARAYEYDTATWSSVKEFNLDQSYDNYLLTADNAFLVALRPQFAEDRIYVNKLEDDQHAYSDALIDAEYYLAESTEIKLMKPETLEKKKDDEDLEVVFEFEQSDELKWNLILLINKNNEIVSMRIEDPKNKESNIRVKQGNTTKVWEKVSKLNIDQLSDVKLSLSKNTRTPTGKIQLHAFLLNKGKKMEYKIHKDSVTGYEEFDAPQMIESNKNQLKIVDNILLPESFSLDKVEIKNVRIQETAKYEPILCAITRDPKTAKVELIYHKLKIQVSEATMKINTQQQDATKRKITKLDYLEYMIEKFGSRAAIFYPQKALLSLHTTYIMKDNKSDKPKGLCDQISDAIQRSLYDKEKKDFKYLDWECNVLKVNKKLNARDVIKSVKNKQPFSADVFIKNLITQIPIQIARSSNNAFKLMYNGEDNQQQYLNAIDSYNLSKEIRLGAYDGLIKSWEGEIIIVTSMGKQSTGKSYMLNHLFGTKFDISGGRCTDGAWLSAKIVKDILYIICDFEGLGSFERSPQEDTLLATFNAAVSNCTIFKCDNRFDRAVEEMFNKFQSGVKYMKGSEKCFGGELMLIIKDVVETGAKAAEEDFQRHIVRLAKESPVFENANGEKESQFFAYQMYSRLSTIPYPPLATESFFTQLNDTIEVAIDDINV